MNLSQRIDSAHPCHSLGDFEVVILIPDDCFSGGIQKSAFSIASMFLSAGINCRILAIKLISGGYASKGHPICSVSVNRKSKIAFWSDFAYRWRKIIRSQRGNVIIALGVSPTILLAMFSFGFKQLVLIGSERVYPPSEKLGLGMHMARVIFYRQLSHIVVQANMSAEWLRKTLRIPGGMISVIPNAVFPPSSNVDSRTKFSPSDYSVSLEIVCVGRLTEQKGFDHALKILWLIKRVISRVRMRIIGEGPLRLELQQRAIDLGVSDKVLFIEPIPDLSNVWRRATVFLLTSRYEGFPNVLAEAMAHGVPPVAFDCATGPSDLISHGESGFLTAVGDDHSAANFIIELANNPKLRSSMSERAKEVTIKFSLEVIRSKWLGLVRNLMLNVIHTSR